MSLLKRKAVVFDYLRGSGHPNLALHGRAGPYGTDGPGDVTYVSLSGIPPLEVAVEVSRDSLERYGLTLDEVAGRIRAASLDVPAGGLDTSKGTGSGDGQASFRYGV